MISNAKVTAMTSVVLLMLAGCGRHELQTAKVSGTVTYNGTPLPHGVVIFTPEKGRGAIGHIRPDGSFTLSTYTREKGDGAVIGLHRVAIICEQEIVAKEKNHSRGLDAGKFPNETRSLIPKIYSNPATSELTFEVKLGEANVADFQITDKPRG